jgi:hypothetical protein
MTPILAKVTAIEKRGDQYQVIVQISPKYRGSFNTLAFGESKPHSSPHAGLHSLALPVRYFSYSAGAILTGFCWSSRCGCS